MLFVMFKNYFNIAWRSLVRSKGYSAIMIGGLATGIAVAILIGLWIVDELSFDHYHKNHSKLAQVMHAEKIKNETDPNSSSVVPLARELRTSYSDDIKRLA